MKVEDLMRRDVRACHPGDSLAEVSKEMWEADVGAIPVIDDERRPIGMVTDRDICIAALFSGRPTGEMTADSFVRPETTVVRRSSPPASALTLMREKQVRRLPVVDDAGQLVGMLSLGDLARARATAPEEVAYTLAAVSMPHHIKASPRADGAEASSFEGDMLADGQVGGVPLPGGAFPDGLPASDPDAAGTGKGARRGQIKPGAGKRAPAR